LSFPVNVHRNSRRKEAKKKREKKRAKGRGGRGHGFLVQSVTHLFYRKKSRIFAAKTVPRREERRKEGEGKKYALTNRMQSSLPRVAP